MGKRASDDKLTMSCYYIVRVLCARGAGIQIKKKKALVVGDVRRGIDNYFSVSADIVEFVNKAENTSQGAENLIKSW